jgi:hypothetical protein
MATVLQFLTSMVDIAPLVLLANLRLRKYVFFLL